MCVCVRGRCWKSRGEEQQEEEEEKKAATGGVGPTGSGAVSLPGFLLADHETVPLQMSCEASPR